MRLSFSGIYAGFQRSSDQLDLEAGPGSLAASWRQPQPLNVKPSDNQLRGVVNMRSGPQAEPCVYGLKIADIKHESVES